MAAGLALLFLLVGAFVTVVLYLLIEGETASPTVMDRSDAERDAQQFGGLTNRTVSDSTSQNDDTEPTDHWGDSRLDDERENSTGRRNE